MNSDSGCSWSSPDNESRNENEIYPRPKRRKLADNPSPVPCGANGLRKSRLLRQISKTSSFGYEPLFFDRTRLEKSPKDHVPDSDSPQSIEVFEDVAVTANNFNTRFLPALRKRREEGPIIYYNGAPFCTDLSGDSNIAPYYDTESSGSGNDVLGCLPFADMTPDLCPEGSPMDEVKSPESVGPVRQDMDIKEDMAGFEDMGSGPNANPSTPLRLEASGIGGVQPCDNFSVKVQVRHATTKMSDSQPVSRFSSFRGRVHRVMHQIPQRATDASYHGLLPSSTVGCRRAVQAELVSAETVHLPPSTLPPPSHVFHPFSSSDSDDEEFSGHDSADEASPSARHGDGNAASPAAPHRSSTRTTRQCSFAWTSSETDESSINLLAHAREYDPDTIAAQEREFEDNNGQQVGTDRARGSSGAAKGVESGCSGSPNSPSHR